MILVSIITPVHQLGPYFRESFLSALNQTYANLEIIIACNGELSINECKKFLKVNDSRVIFLQTSKGRHNARNEALLVSKGKMIQFLDYDDLLFPDKIEIQIDRLGNNIKSTLMISQWKKFNINIAEYYNFPFSILFEEPIITSESLISRLGKSGAFIATASWLVSRELALKGHWIDSPNDDAVYLSYVLKENPRIIMIPKILAGYRMHENNTSSLRTRKNFDALLKSWKIIENNLKPLNVPELNLYLYRSYLYLIAYSKFIENYRIHVVILRTLYFGLKGRAGWRLFYDLKKVIL